jgi:hypothetical protein
MNLSDIEQQGRIKALKAHLIDTENTARRIKDRLAELGAGPKRGRPAKNGTVNGATTLTEEDATIVVPKSHFMQSAEARARHSARMKAYWRKRHAKARKASR